MSELIAEPAVMPEAPADPVAPAEPAWAPPQEEWQQMQAELAYYRQQFTQPEPQPQQQQYPEFDPFADNANEQLFGLIGQAVQQAMAPYQEWQYSQQMSEAEDRALDILDDITSREGEFMRKEEAFEAARALANVFLPEESVTHGYGPAAAEAALQKAATFIRNYEQAVAQAAVERHANQLRTLTGAPGEPNSTYSVGTQQHVTPDYRSGGSVADRFFSG